MTMEKYSKSRLYRLATLLVAVMLLFTLIPNAGAYQADTKSTPYGTMRASVSGGYDDQHGVDIVAYLETSIDSSVTMRKITHGIEAQYRDTGELIARNTYTYTNTNDTGQKWWDHSLDQTQLDRDIAIYTSHQVLYTNSYVIYLVELVPAYSSFA